MLLTRKIETYCSLINVRFLVKIFNSNVPEIAKLMNESYDYANEYDTEKNKLNGKAD